MCFWCDGIKSTVSEINCNFFFLHLCNSSWTLMRWIEKESDTAVCSHPPLVLCQCVHPWRSSPAKLLWPLIQNQPIASKSPNRCPRRRTSSTDIPPPRRHTLTPRHPCSSKKVFLRTNAHRLRFSNFSQPSPVPAALGLWLLLAAASLPRPGGGGSHPQRAATSRSFQAFTADGESVRFPDPTSARLHRLFLSR